MCSDHSGEQFPQQGSKFNDCLLLCHFCFRYMVEVAGTKLASVYVNVFIIWILDIGGYAKSDDYSQG